MRIITLDASRWTTAKDFYNAVLLAIGAPEWHGRNINAVVDSMIWGGINALEPPYTIRISGTASLAKNVGNEIEFAKDALSKARTEFRTATGRDPEVALETTE